MNLRKTYFLLLLALGLGMPVVAQHGGHGAHARQAPASENRTIDVTREREKAQAYFTDTVLVTHEGKKVRLYSDVLEGKTVVVSFTFTTCDGACPLINSTLSRVQERLKQRMGKDVVFVSITVDPETDTPEVLDGYRKQFNAGKGWTFLTGDAGSIETVSARLGQVFGKEDHLTALLVGNLDTARWRKLPAFLSDAVLAGHISDIADEQVQ